MRSPTESFIDRFIAAASAATRLELRLRMFADMQPDMRHIALAGRLEDVEDAIVAKYSTVITETEQAALSGARKVRNKVLHCEFWTAEARLLDHGLPQLDRTVRAGDVATGQIRRVHELTKDEPRIFGWLLEGANGGLFDQAENVFNEAIHVVLRLVNHEAAKAMAEADARAPSEAGRNAEALMRMLEQIQKG